jgi:hypothetical protein
MGRRRDADRGGGHRRRAVADGRGCSFSYQLDSLWGKSKDEAKAARGTDSDHAGSASSFALRPIATLPPENDLAAARAAVNDLFAKGGKDTSMPWEDSQTGARRTITPISSAYNQDGLTCHDFLASYLHNGAESWLQGEACRTRGKWETRNLRPWKNI